MLKINPPLRVARIQTVSGADFSPDFVAFEPSGLVLGWKDSANVTILPRGSVDYMVLAYESPEAVQALFLEAPTPNDSNQA